MNNSDEEEIKSLRDRIRKKYQSPIIDRSSYLLDNTQTSSHNPQNMNQTKKKKI